MSEFVHLHVHSEYSLLDGAARIADLANRAAELGMPALALTDHGVLYGAVGFYKACRAAGVKPIIGCEAYITAGEMTEKASRDESPIYHLTLLAQNAAGYRNLLQLVSAAHLRGFHYKPRVDFALLSRHAEGLIVLSGCMGGEVARHVLGGRMDVAEATAKRYRDLFGDRYYLEIMDHGLLDQKKAMAGILELSRRTSIPLVATNDVHYLGREDARVQDILLAIGTGKTLEDPERFRIGTDQLYLKSADEMGRLFAHVPEALANANRIAEACELDLAFGRTALPAFTPVPDGLDSGAYLRRLCGEGLRARYGGRPEYAQPGEYRKLEERLDYELGVIDRMGYSDYFLIVWDFIRYAHERGIAVGPGRGSSAGSLVAYVLRITDVDPIKYRLVFERFLNPERVSMPDIDIDFSDERRDEVIDYVVRKYGEDRVAQIITFGTMAARAAIRDVGRVLEVPLSEVDRCAKLIPGGPGVTIEGAFTLNPELKAYCEANPKAAELVETARKVEGFPRHVSTHAAGVVISREPLTHVVPLQAGGERTALTQYPMEHLESVGLLKMDFLGLRTLSIIERALKWVKDLHGADLDFGRIPDDDPVTYEMLGRGDTAGVFQLESPGMRRVLKELKPNRFEDIISVNALYRPGPMEFIPQYIAAKHGAVEPDYPHPALEPILKDTYGIIVYQEQIMHIASRMAGFSLGEADLLRRAVSKKKREILDEERAHFVSGCLRMGYEARDANNVYDRIVRFADYGFPRAHAAAYGVLAFQTAYLKAHYPELFMASMLTAVTGHHGKSAEYADDCRKSGIAILPPDVNESGTYYQPAAAPNGGKAIRFGLAAVKNVGTQAIEAILACRKDGPYKDLEDLCRRVDLRICNKRVLESLILCGAMDGLPGHRAQLLAALDETVEAAAKWRKERDDLQLHLFGFTEEPGRKIELPNVPPFSQARLLEYEKELLGLYVSGHPLDGHAERLGELEPDAIHYLGEAADGSPAAVAGMVLSARRIVTRKGQQMAFLEVEDKIAKIEVVVFPAVWKEAAGLCGKGDLVLVLGKLQLQDEGAKIIADEVLNLDEPDLVSRTSAYRRRQRSRGEAAGRPVEPGGRPMPGSASGQRHGAAAAARTGQPERPRLAASRSAGPGAQARQGAERGAAQAQHDAAVPGGAARGTAEAVDPVPAAAPRRSPEAPRSVAPAREAPAAEAAPTAGAAGRGRQTAGGGPIRPRQQKVYVKIAADRQTPERLAGLKDLLKRHAGRLPVVLFYEGAGQTLELNQAFRVKPSPELFQSIEALLGAGAVKVK